MIQSVEEALRIIDTQATGIPYDAIDYLRDLETTDEIKDKLVYALENAYNGEAYYSHKHDVMLPAPLWYAVVAENHLCEEIFEPLLNLFTLEEDWDLMNEQAVILVGLLAEKFPEKFVGKVLDFVEENIKEDNKKPYLYSFEALYFIPESLVGRAYDLMDREHFHWVDHFIRIIGDLQRKDTLEIFKKLFSKFKGQHAAVELEYYIDVLEGKYPDFQPGIPFVKMRGLDWKAHYRQMEFIFDESQSPLVTGGKVGRNDPCPCGSGKKFKNCCMN
jgi:hypothetical protein